VDGFRIDVLWHLVKDAQLRDNPMNPAYEPYHVTYNQLLPVHSVDQPEVHDIIRRMRMLANVHQERVLIGEIYLPVERLVAYYGTDNKGVHLPFNFQLLSLPWEADKIGAAIANYEALLPREGWPNWVLGNHDQVRLASRIGQQQARVAALLLLTLRGTPTIYYGEEIGMHDVPIPAAEVQDPQGLNMPGLNMSRDPARTPMQWDDSPQAGFSPAKPWLRVAADYPRVNVSLQETKPMSLLTFYKRLIALRQQEPALKAGSYRGVYAGTQVLAYQRQNRNIHPARIGRTPGDQSPGAEWG
jgi:alpha-glucosidase